MRVMMMIKILNKDYGNVNDGDYDVDVDGNE